MELSSHDIVTIVLLSMLVICAIGLIILHILQNKTHNQILAIDKELHELNKERIELEKEISEID